MIAEPNTYQYLKLTYADPPRVELVRTSGVAAPVLPVASVTVEQIAAAEYERLRDGRDEVACAWVVVIE